VSLAPITGLVLSGGGARAAYQVGVLKALMELRRQAGADGGEGGNPFQVICGTSAGAINASALGCRAVRAPHALRGLWKFLVIFSAQHV
jgi:NTE family protein